MNTFHSVIEAMQFLPPITPFQSFLLVLILIPTLIALIWGAPWVPTPKNRVRKMLSLADTKKGDKVYDLGCGDGRLVHIASNEYGADAVGFEFSPLIYTLAKLVQPFYWWKGSKGKIQFRNFHHVDLSDADIIVCYLLPHSMKLVQKKCESELKKGSRVVSYAFPIEAWTPLHKEPRQERYHYGPIWVYEMGKHTTTPPRQTVLAPTSARFE